MSVSQTNWRNRELAHALWKTDVYDARLFTALHPDVEEAVGLALAALPKLTAGLQDVVVPVSATVNTTVVPAEAAAFHAARMREAPQMFQPAVLGRLRQGEAVDTPTYIERRRELDAMRRAASGLFAQVDLLVTPTMPVLPVLIAEARDDEASVAVYPRNTRPFNAYGVSTVSPGRAGDLQTDRKTTRRKAAGY